MTRDFKILERVPEEPYKCIVSGLAGPVVDMGKFVPGYGRVYLHVSVVADMAAKLGFLRDDAAEELRAELAEARAAAERYPTLMEEFSDGVLDLLARARASAGGARGDLGGDDPHLAGALADALSARDEREAPRAGDRSAVDDAGGRVREDAPSGGDDPRFDQPAVSSE